MNPRDYRKQVETLYPAPELKAEDGQPDPVQDTDYEKLWTTAIAELANSALESGTRKAALRRLQAGTFLGSEFAPFRAGYVAALRSAASTGNEDLRHAAFDVLANLKDDFARRKLVEGLREPAKALVAPAAALGLLARDDHSSLSELAREILSTTKDIATRAQAIRALGSDPSAKRILGERMSDKSEFREVRRAGAVALRSLDPRAFEQRARRILADHAEFADIKATVKAALQRSTPHSRENLFPWLISAATAGALVAGKALINKIKRR